MIHCLLSVVAEASKLNPGVELRADETKDNEIKTIIEETGTLNTDDRSDAVQVLTWAYRLLISERQHKSYPCFLGLSFRINFKALMQSFQNLAGNQCLTIEEIEKVMIVIINCCRAAEELIDSKAELISKINATDLLTTTTRLKLSPEPCLHFKKIRRVY